MSVEPNILDYLVYLVELRTIISDSEENYYFT